MSSLEIALVILVGVWSVIFIMIGVGLLLIFWAVKRAIDKANNILDRTEEVANKVDLPSKVVIASIVAFMAKNSFGGLKNIISETFLKKKK